MVDRKEGKKVNLVGQKERSSFFHESFDAIIGIETTDTNLPSLAIEAVVPGSNFLTFLPCLELLCTNMLSENAVNPGPSGKSGLKETATWKRRMSRGFPAFFRQF